MANDEHISSDQLMLFIESPEAPEMAPVALHLAACSQCRSEAARLQETAQMVEQLELRPERAKSSAVTSAGWLQKMGQWLGDLFGSRMPVWGGAAFAGIVGIVVFALTSIGSTVGGFVIVAYQDKAVLKITQPGKPGIGFMEKPRVREHDYKAATFTVKRNGSVSVHWQKVPNAKSYKLVIYRVEGDNMKKVAEIKADSTRADAGRIVTDKKARYVYVISGKLASGGVFEARGGFVVRPK